MLENKRINWGIVGILCLLALVVGCVLFLAYRQNTDKVQAEKKHLQELLKSSKNRENAIDKRLFFIASEGEAYHLVEKKDSSYIEKYSGEGFHLLGASNNRLYIYTKESIFYFDLSKDIFSKTEWVSLTEGKAIKQAFLYGDYVYFHYEEDLEEEEEKTGLLRMPIHATSFDEAEQVLSTVSERNWFLRDNYLYYLGTGEESTALYSYSLDTKIQKVVLSNVLDFSIEGKKLLYLQKVSEKKYTIGLYDLGSERVLEIDSLVAEENHTTLLYGNVSYVNQDVYYKKGHDIIKYNGGKRDLYYSSKEDGDASYYGFVFLDASTMQLLYRDNTVMYVKDGKEVESYVPAYEVKATLLDGSERNLDTSNVEELIV